MSERISRDQLLIEVANLISRRGTCGRLQVGAVIAQEGRIVSSGYAGVPAGALHCEERNCDLEKPCSMTIHAEQNAIVWAARKGVSIEGATLYTTDSPCWECAKLIINSGIQEVVYEREFRDKNPIYQLQQYSVMVRQFNSEEINA